MRVSVSAYLDGEAGDRPVSEVDRHLAACAACRAFALDAGRLRRGARLSVTPPAPDVTEAVMARIAARQGAHPMTRAIQVATALLGLLQVVIAAPLLLEAGHMAHEARHIGAFSLALGVGLGYAAWRPHRAVGLLPATVALSGAMALTCALSLRAGILPSHAEFSHLVAPLAVAGLWWMSRSGRPHARIAQDLRPWVVG